MDAAIRVYSVLDACEVLKVSRRTIYRFIKSGLLKTSRIGRKHIIRETELNRFIDAGTGRTAKRKKA